MEEAGEAGVPSQHPAGPRCPALPVSPDLPAPLHPRMATLHSGRGLWAGRSLLARGLPNIEDILGPAGESGGTWSTRCRVGWGPSHWLHRRAQQHQGGRSPLFHPHPGAKLAGILIPQWWPASHPKRRTPQPSAHPSHPRKRRETQLPTLKPRAGGGAGLSVSAGPGQQRSLHGRGCDE